MLGDYNQIIDDRLWVGQMPRPEDAKQLHRIGITHVVCLQADADLKQFRTSAKKIARALEELGIEFVRVPVREFDTEDLALKLPECVAAVEAALKPAWARVYLHCSAGVQRSPTVAAAYLMKTGSMGVDEACDAVLSKRDCQPDRRALERFGDTLGVER